MSNGMMEIARKGVFAPEYFYANELIYIFISVIISNLLLLDIFNRLGLPTSTSVSLVFELIGASFAISLFKIRSGNCSVGMSELINTDKAMTMILGIFVSVAVAFVFSIVIQWITRIIFTFNYKRNLKYKIGIFGGIATTALIYFMLIKGMGGAPFMKESFKLWINEHTMQILGLCLVFFSILMQILYFLKFNVLKIIVLIGTFALAMAFAGNDLVNFIGVPLACLDTYLDVKASGAPLDQHLMGSLNQPANASMVYIIIAGIIMVITLLTSKKAKTNHQFESSESNIANQLFLEGFADEKWPHYLLQALFTSVDIAKKDFTQVTYFLKIDHPEKHRKEEIQFIPNGEWICMLFYVCGRNMAECVHFYLDALKKENQSIKGPIFIMDVVNCLVTSKSEDYCTMIYAMKEKQSYEEY